MTALEIRWANGQIERLVVREYGLRDLRTNSDIARQDFEFLRLLNIAGLPIPQRRHAKTGLLVIDFVDGETAFQPADEAGFVRQVAAFLVRLHARSSADFLFLRFLEAPGLCSELPDDSLSESRIRDALERLGPATSCGPVDACPP